MDYKFLGKINSPHELKKLNIEQTKQLCEEVRDMLISTVSKNGGHLASNLGVVELTAAIHRSFNAPDDIIVFDVGHQCYTHKLLTGRYERFSTIRTGGGLSGFMRPDESEYDPFITGHASNSVAAAYGIHKANVLSGKNSYGVAVIGDGAMTGGLALEALNNIGCDRTNFIVVLNDNKMSISKNVGSMSEHLKKIRLKPGYYRFKSGTESVLRKIPLIGKPIYKFLSKIKRAFIRQVFKNNLFECLGFKYIGPVNGHDIEQLETAFSIAKAQKRPCVIHAVTQKGKGYTFAEKQPDNYHGVSAFDLKSGVSSSGKNFSAAACEALCEIAQNDERICAITAAMSDGTGLAEFAKRFSARFFDVGIAEEYATTFASGLATGGMRPYFAVYSSFLQRSYDEIIHDTAIANLPVCFLVDRAGVVGEDGETHQGLFDVAFLSTIPGMEIYSPASYDELKGIIAKSPEFTSPTAIRYPRGKEKLPFKFTGSDYNLLSSGSKILLISYGIVTSELIVAQKKLAEKGIKTDVLKLNKIYPIANELIQLISSYSKVYLFEEGIKKGGIAEHIVSRAKPAYSKIIAVEDKFVPAMKTSSAHKLLGLDSESIIALIEGENN